MATSDDLRLLLTKSTKGRWIENGTLVGPTMYETDASTSEDEPSAWITFKTPQPDSDRALWILLRNNAKGLLRLWQAAEMLDSMMRGHAADTWPITDTGPLMNALAELRKSAHKGK